MGTEPGLASIISLNWDHYADLTGPFIRALEAWTPQPFELVVVDQGSNPGDRYRLLRDAARYPWLRLLQLEENVGFPAGCNAGARSARGDYLVFMNNDVLIEGDWLTPIREYLAAYPKNLVGASLVERGGWNEFAVGSRQVAIPYLEGWLLAMSRSAWQELGPFDEGFGKGSMEDVDLCWRARRLGYSLVPLQLPLVHLRGRTVTDGRLDQPGITRTNYELMRTRVEEAYRG